MASLCLGPTPAGEAVERCERILSDLGGAPRPTMMVLDSLALCSVMLERFEEVERLLARADAIRGELTGKLWKVGRVEFSAWTYLLAGRPADAERVLRPAYEAFARIGEKGGTLAIHAALLAEAVSALGGRGQQAEELSQIAEAAAADSEDVAAQGEWRMARATALARNGSTADAERVAREATMLAAATQCPLVQPRRCSRSPACCCSEAGPPRLGRPPKTPWPWRSARATSCRRREPAPCSASCARPPRANPRLRWADSGGGLGGAAQPAR